MNQPARRYTSEIRDEQARRTRRAIVAASHDLFLARPACSSVRAWHAGATR